MKQLKQAQKLFGNYIFKEIIAELVKQEGELGTKRDLDVVQIILDSDKIHLFPSCAIYIDRAIKGHEYWDIKIAEAKGKFERGC